MHLKKSIPILAICSVAANVSAFIPASFHSYAGNKVQLERRIQDTCSSSSAPLHKSQLYSAIEDANETDSSNSSNGSTVSILSAAEINSRLEAQLLKLREKDATSPILTKEDLNVVFEDEHILVVDKPAGVLCVPNKDNSPSLSQAVFDAYGSESGRADKMVVHRLGMDTSGLVVFARTEAALKGMNTLFRTRQVTRSYEALVCGSIEEDEGVINMPLMRDYENPPYMRVSTDEHQRALMGLSAEDVGKKLLERPKESLTKFAVAGKEELEGNAVSRVTLSSISGRTHQLNVHCAAFGHPIVGDKVYGINGEAAANGGLEEGTSSSKASVELQEAIASASGDKPMCVHAKTISFEHPVTGEKMSWSSDTPF